MNIFSRRHRKAKVGELYVFPHGKFVYELRFVDKDGTHFFRKEDGGFIMSADQVQERLIHVCN